MIKRFWNSFSLHDKFMIQALLSLLLFVSLEGIAKYNPNGYVSTCLLGNEYDN